MKIEKTVEEIKRFTFQFKVPAAAGGANGDQVYKFTMGTETLTEATAILLRDLEGIVAELKKDPSAPTDG